MRQFINHKNKTKKGLIAIEFVIVMALAITISLIVMAAAKNNNQLSSSGVMKQSKDFFNQKIGEIFGNNPGSGNPGGGITPPEDATGGIVFQIPSGTAAVFSKQETDETILSWAKTNLSATDKDGNNITDSMQIVSKSLDDTGGFVTLKVTDSQSYSKTANLPVIFEKNDYSILVTMPNGQPYRFIQGIASEDISSWVRTRADITNKELEDISSLVEIEYISGDLSSAGTKTIEIRAKLGELVSETVSFQINIEIMDISTCNNFATSSTFKSKPIGDGGPLTPYQISTVEELNYIRDSSTKVYIELSSDIDFNSPSSYLNQETFACTKSRKAGEGWIPIGSATKSFIVEMDGKNYTISGLYSKQIGDVGLFGVVNNSIFKNLKLKDFEILGHRAGSLYGKSSGTNSATNIELIDVAVKVNPQAEKDKTVANYIYIGGLVGEGGGLTVSNISGSSNIESLLNNGNYGTSLGVYLGGVSGTIATTAHKNVTINTVIMSRIPDGAPKTATNIGGFNGGSTYGNIDKIHTSGSIDSDSSRIGGISSTASPMKNGTTAYFPLSNISSSINIKGLDNLGGLFGSCSSGIALNGVYYSGTIIGNNQVGGLIGQLEPERNLSITSSPIQNSYFSGRVYGNSNVGGLLGRADYESELSGGYYTYMKISIIKCYSSGIVSGSSYHGGLFGYQTSSPSAGKPYVANCFYNQDGVLNPSPTLAGTAITKAQAVTQNVYSGFDFSTIWNINEGTSTPYLRNNLPKEPPTVPN